jgi:hypothetical protein
MYYKAFSLVDYTESGTWALSADKLFLNFYRTSPTTDNWYWRIIKLKENELWVEDADSSVIKELHLVPY